MASTRSKGAAALVASLALALGVVVVCAGPSHHGTGLRETSEVDEGEETTDPVDATGKAESTGAHMGSRPFVGFSVRDAPAGVRVVETTQPLQQTAQELVGEYRDYGLCLVCQAGYLDLLGNAWGCVMEGPGWVDVCLVTEGTNRTSSVVRVERIVMDQEDEDGLCVGESRSGDG